MWTFVLEIVKILPSVLPLIVSLFRSKPAPEPEPEPPVVVDPPVVVEPPVDPPTAPIDPKPESIYLRLDRAKDLAEKLEVDLQTNTWAGWRDPEAVARFCPNLAPLPDADYLSAFAVEGMDLTIEGEALFRRMSEPNKRYPDRSSVRKEVFTEFRARLDKHLQEASDIRALLKGQPGEGSKWDTIKGWCEYIRKEKS